MIISRRNFCAVLASALLLAPIDAMSASTDVPTSFETERIVIKSGPKAGIDVILLPGLATPGAVWDRLVSDLEGRATLHIVDVKGFGSGDGATNAKGGIMKGVLADITVFIDERGLQKPALIGHSLGGTLALQAGIETPDLFGKLMIVDALPFVALLFDPQATVESVASQAASIRDQMASAPAGVNAEQTAERYAIDDDAKQQIADWIADSDPTTVAQAFYEDMQTDLRPKLSEIEPPVTLVVPVPPEAEDQNFPQQYKALYSEVPELKVVSIEDARHFVMLDQPEEMTAAVEKFLGLDE